MGFFGLFKKKKKVDSSKKVVDVPLARVEELVGKGLSKRQVVDFLKGEGFSVDLVEKAFSQLSSKQGVLSNTGAPVSEGLEPLPPPPVAGSGLPPAPGEGLPDLGVSPVDSLEPDVDGEISKVGDVEGLVEVIVEEKFAEMVAVGDVNTGGVQISSGSALYPPPYYSPIGTTLVNTINGPGILGSYVNNTRQGFIIGAGAGATDSSSKLVGATSDVIYWEASLSDISVP